MKWIYKAFIFLIIILIISFCIYLFSPAYIGIISLVSAIVQIGSIIFFFKQSKEGDIVKTMEKMIDQHSKEKAILEKEKEEHKGEIQVIKAQYEIEKNKTLKMSMLVDNIGVALNKEEISKDDLIENISHPLKAIIFFKTWEDMEKRRGLFIKTIYPDMHVYGIRSGLSIIPPNHVPQHLSNTKIIEWFNEELDKRLPKDYQYNIPFITVVDLTDIKHFHNLDEMNKRGQFSYLSHIPAEELIPPEMIIGFLARKRKISPRDIIEIPNLLFLIDEGEITTEDRTNISNNKEQICNKIKNYLNITEFKTTDLANIDEKEFTLILNDCGIKHPLSIAKMIIRNAKIWKIILERHITSNK